MKKSLLILPILILALFQTPFKTNAEGEFETQYDVNYVVQPKGETAVTYNITITNKRTDVVATKYSVSLRQTEINEVKASDKKGTLDVKKDVTGDITTLTVDLREQVVGMDKKNYLTLVLKTPSVANKVGEIWNINIPQVQNVSSTARYDVTLSVPNSFGPTIFVSPQVAESIENNLRVYRFTKKDLENSGVSASYGKYQSLNYKLKYQLQNDSPFTITKEVALPPDIKDRQAVYYLSLKPAPVNVKRDGDGNILAQYRVKAHSTEEVELIGTARIMGRQYSAQFGGKFQDIPGKLISSYTKAEKYWEVNSPVIKEIAKNLKDPNKNVTENAQAAYNFVVQNLNYNVEVAKNGSVERKGALKILSAKNDAACMEFTDLFIAVVRAMGIPAREINGYAFSNNTTNAPISVNLSGGDILHAWPEYYDPNFGWVAVDPTWGATSKTDYFTKLDTNHFAFVVKGTDPEYPLPAGAYKTDDQTNTVDINFADSSSPFAPNPGNDLEQAQRFIVKEKGIPYIVGGVVLLAAITVLGVYSFLQKKRIRKINQL